MTLIATGPRHLPSLLPTMFDATTLVAIPIAMQVTIKMAILSRDVLSYTDRDLASQPGLPPQ
jgi:hypothetical protein